MANLSYAYCPACSKEAKGKAKVDELFGFRNNGDISWYNLIAENVDQEKVP